MTNLDILSTIHLRGSLMLIYQVEPFQGLIPECVHLPRQIRGGIGRSDVMEDHHHHHHQERKLSAGRPGPNCIRLSDHLIQGFPIGTAKVKHTYGAAYHTLDMAGGNRKGRALSVIHKRRRQASDHRRDQIRRPLHITGCLQPHLSLHHHVHAGL